jgi:hypothetical protein
MLALRLGTIGPAALFNRAFFAALLTSFLLGVPSVRAACVLGLGNCNGGISGNYVGVRGGTPEATLKIDSTTIATSVGPLTISATYTVKSIEGNQVLIEVSFAGEKKHEALLIVDGDTLHANNSFFNGDWKRK